MKNILVPTDFSEHANNALDYAVAIANRFGSHITLFYAYKVYSTTGMLVSVERFMKDGKIRSRTQRKTRKRTGNFEFD